MFSLWCVFACCLWVKKTNQRNSEFEIVLHWWNSKMKKKNLEPIVSYHLQIILMVT